MKKLLLPLTAALILLLLAACGGKEAPPPAPSSHLPGAAVASSGAPDGSPAEAPGGSSAGEAAPMPAGGAVVSSANYDAGAGAFVTPSEALERLSLTLEGLRDTLAAQALQPEEYETRLAELYEPSAFFVREDGSMVFFLRAYYEIVGNEDAMGPYAPVCYDSAAGCFSLGDPAAPLLAAGPDSLDPPLLYGRSEKLYQ